jgi:RNA polymerase sigma-70 factor, ECF subfamily
LRDDRRDRFETLFKATFERVLTYALRRSDPDQAEDVVAETFTVAWRRLDVIPHEPLPWLYAVARRTLANSRRSRRRREQLVNRLVAEHDAASLLDADPGDRFERMTLVREALGHLSRDDREALMLVAWEGLDHEQSAAVMGVSAPTFAVRLHRARRRLDHEMQRSPSMDERVAIQEQRKDEGSR